MRIPSSQGPTVGLNPLTSFNRTNSVVQGPSVNSAIGEQLGRIAQQVQQAEDHADNLRTEEAINQTRALQMQLQGEAGQAKGANVLPKNGKAFTDGYLERFDQGLAKIGEGLNARQRQLYQQRASLLRTEFQVRVNAHEQAETNAHADSVDLGTIKIESEAAGQYRDPRTVALSMTRVQNAVDSMAQRNGWSEEEKTGKLQEALTGFHANVLDAALNTGDTAGAGTYLNAHAQEMTSEMVKHYKKVIAGETLDGNAIALSQQALEVARSAGLDQTKGLELISQAAGNNKDLRDKAITIFDHDFGVYQKQRKEQAEQDEASVWGAALRGGPSAAYKALGASKTLDDTHKAELLKKVQNYFKGDAEDRTAAREARKEWQLANLVKLQLNPEAVWKMTPNQITNLTPFVGVEGVSKLVTMQQQMQKTGLDSAKMDVQQFTSIAKQYGLSADGLKGKAKDAMMIRIGLLQEQLNNRLTSIYANAKWHELTPEEKGKEMRNLLKEVPTRQENDFWFDETGKKFLFEAGVDEIDAPEKPQALAYLAEVDAPATPENVWVMVEKIREKKAADKNKSLPTVAPSPKTQNKVQENAQSQTQLKPKTEPQRPSISLRGIKSKFSGLSESYHNLEKTIDKSVLSKKQTVNKSEKDQKKDDESGKKNNPIVNKINSGFSALVDFIDNNDGKKP